MDSCRVVSRQASVPLVGIVVIGRNEGERLVSCLSSLPRTDVHTVYVDSGSTDNSIHAAAENGAQIVLLDLSLPFTAARARNAGIAALAESGSAMEYVQFIDGDCALAPDWIETARAFLDQNPKVAVVCGRRRERFPRVSIYNAMCDREWDTPIGETGACGGDALMRWAPLQDVNGYNGTLVAGEEPELCARLRAKGWKIWRIDAEMTLHDAAMTHFRQWWTRARRAGFAYAQVASTRKGDTPDVFAASRRRVLMWGFGFPIVAIGAVAFVPPVGLIVCAVPLAQIVRAALRDKGPLRWAYSAFNMLAKTPEAIGMTQFLLGRLRHREHQAILYK